MKVSEKERRRISRFVCGQLQDEPDLNTLTLGILKRQYLAHVQCESLSPAAKAFMKQVVEEELIKMEEGHDQNGSDLKTRKTQNKRKRDKENDEVFSEGEDESTAKKSRCQSSSLSSESEDIEDSKTGSKEDEQIKSRAQTEEKQMTKSQKKKKGNWINSDESSDEKVNDSEEERGENNGSSSEEEVKKENSIEKGEQNKKSPGQKLPQSDEDSDADNKSERSNKVDNSDSSDDNEKENGMVEKQNNNSDSDSSSLPSLEDESGTGTKTTQEKEPSPKKKNTTKKKESTEGQRDDNKAIVRLKRYITLCGVRRNYKKLFEGCKSIRAKVSALKKELEDLGVHGNPTIEKCKKVRMKREEDEELADIDVSNIIATQGRPKRRGTQQEHCEPPSMTYQRALNSCSDSDEESTAQRGPRRTTHWANLQGIISDDADSN
ncbi:uncharacterized protein V6R79_002092 [Siganus canaliculatus]